jgi:MFS family permease
MALTRRPTPRIYHDSARFFAVSEADTRVPWRAAFEHRDFNFYQGARLLSILGTEMQGVAVGWQIYDKTHRQIDLAWVGLAQFVPAVCLSLVTGQVADRFERRRILQLCYGALALLAATLHFVAHRGGSVLPIYAVLVGIGVARAFMGPAMQSIVPSLVPLAHFRNAVAWSSSVRQIAMVVGPVLGGAVYTGAGGAAPVYAVTAGCSAGALVFVSLIARPVRGIGAAAARPSVLGGVRYVWSNKVVLGAISLDLFAVLLGGATALLPVYARDILKLGPWALGILRGAPSVGAALMGILVALRPIDRHAGAKMLACVAIFGAATIVFGESRNFWLSLAALVVIGASDMVSVVVRLALVQLATPDAMRGRVSAVNMVFIGASNELGEFESGLTAQWFGTVPSVVLGGVGTLVVVTMWAFLFPALRRVDRLSDVEAKPVVRDGSTPSPAG